MLKLTIAYEGTNFSGWQRQKKGRTVQGLLEEALGKLAGHPVRVAAAGRTDSGVHAWGQVAHAAVKSQLPLKALHRALNALLPEDLLVRSVRIAPPGFHARYGARSKWYRYRIWNRPDRPLFDRAVLLHVPQPLDLKAMQAAARGLQGRRDFRCFHSSGRPVKSTVRSLSRLAVRARGGEITIDAEADGFLYHMVRRIAGFLIEIGKGNPPPRIPPTASAKGLRLMQVRYPARRLP